MSTKQGDSTGDALREDLAALTEWGASRPESWRAALEQVDKEAAQPARPQPWWSLRAPVSKRLLAGLAAAAVLVLVAGAILTSHGVDRRRGSVQGIAPRSAAVDQDRFAMEAEEPAAAGVGRHKLEGGTSEGRPDALKAGYPENAMLDLAGGVSDQSVASPERQAVASPERQVVRKATVELQVPDVRAAFLKASLLVSQAGGEFIEDSAMTGSGPGATANLTLRIAAARLPEVMGELRPLGKVLNEQVKGEDVTTQAVDLEARARNERRVEQELLDLLASQKDAPLKDVLEVRQRLAEVRTEIERIEGQRQHLSRLVSLATVLVLIRADDAPQPAPKPASTIWTHVGEAFAGAWRTGVTALIDTLAWLVSVLVGGLIWWAVAAAVLWVAVRKARRAAELRGAL